MADQELLMRVTLPDLNGLAKSATQNTFAAVAAAPITDANAASITAQLANFYNGTYVGHTVAAYLAGTLDRGANKAMVAFYDITAHLDGSPHGSPIFTKAFTLGASDGATNLPSECAVVLTYVTQDYAFQPTKGAFDPAIPSDARAIAEGAPTSHPGYTNPKARSRGRIYLGPLTITAREGSPITVPCQVSQSLINTALNAFEDTQDNLHTLSPAVDLGVWSRRDQAIVTIGGDPSTPMAQMDNAFDTQRRRGQPSTGKTTVNG